MKVGGGGGGAGSGAMTWGAALHEDGPMKLGGGGGAGSGAMAADATQGSGSLDLLMASAPSSPHSSAYKVLGVSSGLCMVAIGAILMLAASKSRRAGYDAISDQRQKPRGLGVV